jgi:hypothetical protein
MSIDRSNIEFSAKMFGGRKWPRIMVELVEARRAYENHRTPTAESEEFSWAFVAAHDRREKHGALGFEFVLQVLATRPTAIMQANLAAGPIEDDLTNHGAAIIDRVEDEARRNPDV